MINRIEKKIQRMLMVGNRPGEIFDELTLYLFRKKITEEEKVSILKFAINAGLHKQLLSVFVDLFHERQTIPWNLYIETLNQYGIEPPKHVLESVYKGIRKQNREEDLLLSDSWSGFDDRLKEIREKLLKEQREEFSQKKQQLFERLNFYKFQRMIEEQKKILKIMLRMYPTDKTIAKELREFQETQAQDVIARSTLPMEEEQFLQVPAKLSKAETEFLMNTKQYVLECIKQNNKTAYNFIIMFKFMGQPGMGLEIINGCHRNKAISWIEIDLLLEARRFVECLDRVHDIELKFSDDPETTFAATYARAQALHHLGQGSKAIDLLKSIVDIRPDYRSANSLLTEWAQQWM